MNAFNLPTTLNTDGKGLWSEVAQPVWVNNIKLRKGLKIRGEEKIWGELRVYFGTPSWDVDENGLIYTDEQFESELRELLEENGLPGGEVSYSEAGMQGDDFVSFDAGHDFYIAWMNKFDINPEHFVKAV